MRPAPFEYLEPADLDEAVTLLARHRDRAAVLAGGQSLLAQLNSRVRTPELVLAIAAIPELGGVEVSRERVAGQLCIGASVTQRAVQATASNVPVLAEALAHVGHVPTRNRGTLGGSIAFADPSAELPLVLLALGGSVRAVSTEGERTVPAAALFTGPFRTALRADELLTSVRLPLPVDGTRWVFEQRHFRRHAKVSVVAGFAAAGAALTVAAAGLTDTPIVLDDAATLLAGSAPADRAEDGIGALAGALAARVTPNADQYGPVGYRRRLVTSASSRGRRVSRPARRAVTVAVNGEPVSALVEPRTLLVDFLRESAGLTGTHAGCHQGWCGACTVLVDGASTRSCLTLAVQAQGAEVTTVEGVEHTDGTLSELQRQFIERFGFQCGFCTPGFIVLGTEILAEAAEGAVFDRARLQRRLAANICRCTGYQGILDALQAALSAQAAPTPAPAPAPATEANRR